MAPECVYTGKCSEKSDVFAYGIFLLELITGQRALDLARLANGGNLMLLDLVRGVVVEKRWEILVDANMQGNHLQEEVEQLLQLAFICTRESPEERPTMSEIVRMLETGDHGLVGRPEDWLYEETLHQELIVRARGMC